MGTQGDDIRAARDRQHDNDNDNDDDETSDTEFT